MRLTSFSDYALRILIFAATKPDNLVTIAEISKSYGISRNHLMKVTSSLAMAGYVETLRGSGGGMRVPPASRSPGPGPSLPSGRSPGRVARRGEPARPRLPR